jgi:hypothetical protein
MVLIGLPEAASQSLLECVLWYLTLGNGSHYWVAGGGKPISLNCVLWFNIAGMALIIGLPEAASQSLLECVLWYLTLGIGSHYWLTGGGKPIGLIFSSL